MELRENRNQELLSGLNSPDEKTVATTLQELRIHGNAELIPALFKLYFSAKMDHLNDEIIGLLNDVKDPAAVPYFINGIKEYRGNPGFEDIVAACWQCGLDFSPYIDLFLELVIEEDYYTSLEAFSVIEENVSALSSQQRTARLEFIRSRLELLSPEKRSLVKELMSLISNISGPFRLDPDHLN